MASPVPIETGYVARQQFYTLHMRKQRWAVAVCHRRAGKTVACINDLIDAAIRCQRPRPHFAYVAPLYSQAKDVAWNYLKQYTAPIPGMVPNEAELRVDLPGDRRIRLYGADNYERLRGLYFDGIILDEFGDMDPQAWSQVIRPALADREGWAVFIGTPNGQNHFAEMWDKAVADPAWFTLMLKASETGLLPKEELRDARNQMSEEAYAAEFECSFAASVVGSFWGRAMQQAEQDGRIGGVPYQPEVGVETWWDLGVDNMRVWLTQTVGREVHVIDYLDDVGQGLPAYAKALQERGYVYKSHNAPHDIQAREIGTGKTRIETAASLGIKFSRVPDVDLADGIDAARAFISRCWFDRKKTEAGRKALVGYRRTWDEKRKMFSPTPHKDWTNHAADAFRYLSIGHKYAPPRRDEPADRPRRMQLGGSTGRGEWMG